MYVLYILYVVCLPLSRLLARRRLTLLPEGIGRMSELRALYVDCNTLSVRERERERAW
jgi:hypothetical protein